MSKPGKETDMANESEAAKKHADLPAWYHRIKKKSEDWNPEFDCRSDYFEPSDFDEDISELEEEDEDSFQCRRCDAEGDLEAGCECYLEYDSDDISEPYDGPDAAEYYRLKERREERKQELKEEREAEEEDKRKTLKLHKQHVDEVRAACEALAKGTNTQDADGPPIDLFKYFPWGPFWLWDGKTTTERRHRGVTYDLYSVDYVEHCYQYDVYLYWKYIEFGEWDEAFDEEQSHTGESRKRKAHSADAASTGKKEETIESRVYVSPDHDMCFKDISAPERASLKTYRLETWDGEEEVETQFVGQDFLRMFVRRDIVEANADDPVPDSAPEVFEFVGVVSESSKEIAKRSAKSRETYKAQEAQKAHKVHKGGRKNKKARRR
ncbi:hypothetical protein F5Y05DRAFT_121224 [Hypoxylon sp. FL0543]|nr:hypothetical protein F5Y05DRAFT_121224 [Hypoxylon sp. FL0543]